MIIMYEYDDKVGAVVRQERYQGATLCTRERNWADDSEWYAVVWDAQEGKLKEVVYASTCGGTERNKAIVDATPDVIKQAGLWLAKWAFDRWREANEEQAQLVKVGKTVKVVRGRKVPVGLVGQVVMMYDYTPNEWTRIVRVVIEVNGHRYVTNVSNVVVDNPQQYLKPMSEGRRIATAVVRDGMWHLPFVRRDMVMM